MTKDVKEKMPSIPENATDDAKWYYKNYEKDASEKNKNQLLIMIMICLKWRNILIKKFMIIIIRSN